jgi:hypothetical protein
MGLGNGAIGMGNGAVGMRNGAGAGNAAGGKGLGNGVVGNGGGAENGAVGAGEQRFKKHVLTGDFVSEGVAIGDVNKDGKPDILAGAYWFEAPGWVRHAIAAGKHYSPTTEFSNSFLDFCMDVNLDGWVDLIRISLPGEEAVWYENPQNKAGFWPEHPILKNAGNESPAFVDVDGDGRPDILCNDPVAKEMIWMKAPVMKGDTGWTRYIIAGGKGEGAGRKGDVAGRKREVAGGKGEVAGGKGDVPGVNRYTHGLGLIDMNADGRKDVVITRGWWECPVDPRRPDWVFHPADLGEDCSQIYALDVRNDGQKNGAQRVGGRKAGADGRVERRAERRADGQAEGRAERGSVSDLISASAHRYGIWWHEKVDTGWVHHTIFDGFSESHALAMADVNGDGFPDLVTGKRYFAHNGEDPGAFEPSVLYWFEFRPGVKPVWIPHLIDNDSGVGLQVLVQDINKDGLPDIIVANKKGVFFFEQTPFK